MDESIPSNNIVRFNMIIEPRELNKEFRRVIRSIDRTSKWKSKGARRYWDFNGKTWVGLELIYLDKMTTRDDMTISYSVLFSYLFENKPYFYSPNISTSDDRITLEFDIDITNRRILGFTEKTDRRKINSKIALERDNLLFKNTVHSCLGEWEGKYCSKEFIIQYLEQVLQPEEAFWVVREKHGNNTTKKCFLEYLKSNPYARPDEKLTSWLENVGIIDSAMKRKIDRASIQAQGRIPEFMGQVIEELE